MTWAIVTLVVLIGAQLVLWAWGFVVVETVSFYTYCDLFGYGYSWPLPQWLAFNSGTAIANLIPSFAVWTELVAGRWTAVILRFQRRVVYGQIVIGACSARNGAVFMRLRGHPSTDCDNCYTIEQWRNSG